jgi:hypothetical protein
MSRFYRNYGILGFAFDLCGRFKHLCFTSMTCLQKSSEFQRNSKQKGTKLHVWKQEQ